jgi:uncharacterized protein (TIGR00251 family)
MRVRVIPNAKGFSISLENGALKIRVRAPAEGGRANGELEKALSKKLGKKVSITKGFKSREKEIQVEGMDEEEVVQKVYSLSSRE